MIKRTIIETTKEYDESGKLIREIVTETKEDDDTTYFPFLPSAPYIPPAPDTPTAAPSPWWSAEPYMTVSKSMPSIDSAPGLEITW